MKRIAKQMLRNLGLLRWARRIHYRYSYRQWISKLGNKKNYEFNELGLSVRFSIQDPFSATFFAYHFTDGIYEKEALKIILDDLETDSVFADVGANIGYFTCIAAMKAPRGKVYAFELGAENCKILSRNVELNRLKNVYVEHCAVSDTSGTVFHEESSVGNAVLKIIESNKNNDPDIVSIRSISLDEYFASQPKAPKLIKIDVEGAEMKVLRGMSKLLTGSIKILIEIHEKDLKYFNSSKEEVLAYLQSFGFSLRTIGNDVKKNLLVFASK